MSGRAREDVDASLQPDDLESLSIYIHWPFCRSKCPYCDFNSHVREGIDEVRWHQAYLTEIDRIAGEVPQRSVVSVFFGGGTPSLMAPATTAAILERIACHWPMAADVEITLEANPSTAEADRFRSLRSAGVNRLSLGVQSLDDAALRFLGRGHSAQEARAAVDLAARTFPRFSFDLIWGWPEHVISAWRRQLLEALVLVDDHVSVYQLTIEPGTAFFREGVPALLEADSADFYEATQELMEAAGLPAYEISNHAREGAFCRHNVAIWRGGDYAGIGPGAHGRLTGDGITTATRALRHPEKWLNQVEQQGDGTAERVSVSAAERREELVLTGLRLTDGIFRRDFMARANCQPEDAVDPSGLALLLESDLLVADASGVRATPRGRMCLNAVISRLLT